MFPSSEQWLFLANSYLSKFFGIKGKSDAEKIKTILVVKLDEIGDMATATHVFKLLKRNYPDSKITLLCKSFNRSLMKNDPNIDEIITNTDEFNKRFDIVVELRGTWKTFFKSILHPPKYRVDRGTVRLRNRGNQLHEVDTNFEIIKPLLEKGTINIKPQIYFSKEDLDFTKDFLNKNSLGKFAILHTGARRLLRQWPLERFSEIAAFLKKTYNLDIILAGTEEDLQRIESIRKSLDFKTASFASGTTLSQFAALCSLSSFFIGNESGPLHIAAAFDVPLIGLYGPGVPNIFYPIGTHSKVIHKILHCNPCDQIHCVHQENPCIQRIETEEVKQLTNLILHL